jgi:hypothetical protein
MESMEKERQTIRLVQLRNASRRAVALVSEPELIVLKDIFSVYDLAHAAIDARSSLSDLILSHLSAEKWNYDEIYDGKSEWRLLPSFDHPREPLSCMLSGTGLTHKNSALNRQMMHRSEKDQPTDSMVMYQWGVEGGNPEKGKIGVQPEWFYKGNGSMVKAHGEGLELPVFADDGGEEPELAGAYVIDQQGIPYRVGLTTGNEFSDHVMEKKNYLYLAPSKLRECAIGPELVIDPDLSDITGKVSVFRKGSSLWAADIRTGEKNMAHNLANLEHHHFKYPGHRLPFQAHIHFFGADAFSFGSQVRLQDGDEMRMKWNGFGRELINALRVPGKGVAGKKEELITIRQL